MDATQAQTLQADPTAAPAPIACWFDVGAGVGIGHKPAEPFASQSAARALRHLLSRGIATTVAPDTAARALRGYPAAASHQRPLRSTFPGSTSFKALCNSYLRKLLRGAAPEAVYWVAQATLPDGDRIRARLRLTFVVEDVRVEKIPAPPDGETAPHAPEGAAPVMRHGEGRTAWIRDLD
jgi:hypothetical protein